MAAETAIARSYKAFESRRGAATLDRWQQTVLREVEVDFEERRGVAETGQ